LERPGAGFYYRGIVEIVNESVDLVLPSYVESFTDFTVQLTPIGVPRLLSASRVNFGTFTVYGQPGEFYWTVFGKRNDINVEPKKSETVVHGEGPYKWIN